MKAESPHDDDERRVHQPTLVFFLWQMLQIALSSFVRLIYVSHWLSFRFRIDKDQLSLVFNEFRGVRLFPLLSFDFMICQHSTIQTPPTAFAVSQYSLLWFIKKIHRLQFFLKMYNFFFFLQKYLLLDKIFNYEDFFSSYCPSHSPIRS